MKSIRKILLSLLFLSACSSSMVFAEERVDTANIVVPSRIDMIFNEDGTNAIGEFEISNKSQLPITIDNIGITEKNDWDLVPSGTYIPTDTRCINIKLDGVDLVEGGNKVLIPITEGTSKALPLSVERGLWTSIIKESAFDIQIDYTFDAKNFTLSFNTDGGSGVESISSYNGSRVTLPSSTKMGYTLEGWVDSEGILYNKGSEYEMPIGGGSLTARWKANTCTYDIVYLSSSGKSLGSSSVIGVYDSSLDISAPVKEGYITPSIQTVNFDSTTPKTITFIYQLIDYKIDYNLDGGEIPVIRDLSNLEELRYSKDTLNIDDINNDIEVKSISNPISYNVETPTFTLINPSKEGDTFKGWSNSIDSYIQDTITIVTGSVGDLVFSANWGTDEGFQENIDFSTKQEENLGLDLEVPSIQENTLDEDSSIVKEDIEYEEVNSVIEEELIIDITNS